MQKLVVERVEGESRHYVGEAVLEYPIQETKLLVIQSDTFTYKDMDNFQRAFAEQFEGKMKAVLLPIRTDEDVSMYTFALVEE